MKRIVFVYVDAGGGHRNAAIALQAVIQQQKLPWNVELLNLQEVLDPLDFVLRFTGVRIEDTYNSMLRNGWTLGAAQLLRVLQLSIRFYHRKVVQVLVRKWQEMTPDMVVSLIPNFNRELCKSFDRAFPGNPFVTVLTDIADYPPHFWIERQKQFVICGSERAVEQARSLGNPSENIFQTSGMILNPRFYEYDPVDRAKERVKLGLDPALSTGIVLFGGQGARKKMLQINELLSRSSLPVQLIFICGKNQELIAALQAQHSPRPRLIEGFTTNIPYYMQLADFFIGKPGPGSLAEALTMHLPVIVERNAWTLPQERYNTDWVREKEVGLVLSNFAAIEAAVSELLVPANYSRFRGSAERMQNRALFQIPEIFDGILTAAATGVAGTLPSVRETA